MTAFRREDKDSADTAWQCSWKTGDRQCRMPYGLNDGARNYCTWHWGCLNWVGDPEMQKRINDPEAFSEWVQSVRRRQGFYNCSSPWCKYTVASLWASVRGFSGELTEDSKWVNSNTVGFTKPLPEEAVKEYGALRLEIEAHILSPKAWRIKLAALNEKYGVTMAIPPIYEDKSSGPVSLSKPR